MEIKQPTRRIVTGHDAKGKAVALFDGPVISQQRSAGGNAITMLWVTGESPADVNAITDRAEAKVGVPPPLNGSIFRIVDFPPTWPCRPAPRS